MDAYANIEVLSVRLRQAQTDYEWARSRGDEEHAAQARVRMQAITIERDRYFDRAGSASSVTKALVA